MNKRTEYYRIPWSIVSWGSNLKGSAATLWWRSLAANPMICALGWEENLAKTCHREVMRSAR